MMKLEPQEKPQETQPGKSLLTLILQQVMHQLGQPDGRVRVQVRKLWEDRYRVNVITTPETGSASIAHSYFLVTDGDGTIIAATPRITKQY